MYAVFIISSYLSYTRIVARVKGEGSAAYQATTAGSSSAKWSGCINYKLNGYVGVRLGVCLPIFGIDQDTRPRIKDTMLGVEVAVLYPIYKQCLGVSSALSHVVIPTPTLCDINTFYNLEPLVCHYSLSYILTLSAISQILDTYLSSISWPRPPAILKIRSFRELLPRISTWSPVFGPPRGENLSGSCGISYVVIGILAGLYRVIFRQPFEHT